MRQSFAVSCLYFRMINVFYQYATNDLFAYIILVYTMKIPTWILHSKFIAANSNEWKTKLKKCESLKWKK